MNVPVLVIRLIKSLAEVLEDELKSKENKKGE